MEKDLFPIGRVVRPHGVKGKIKVEYFGEDTSRFPPCREVFIEDSTGKVKSYQILEVIPQPPRLIIKLEGIEKIEEVEPLRGKEVLIKRETLPPLNEGEYYWMDILGMGVETEEGRRIGKVKEIFPTGANDIYVVEGKNKEIFLPATEEVIQRVDLEARVIKVVRLEGLWEEEDEI
jgi:16S rRNA processing protein RimM